MTANESTGSASFPKWIGPFRRRCSQIPVRDFHLFDRRCFTRIVSGSFLLGESFSPGRSLPFRGRKQRPEFLRCIPADPQKERERHTSSTTKLLLQDLGPVFPGAGCEHAYLSHSSAALLLCRGTGL